MTSLLPDESYCTSELGRIIFQSKLDWSGRSYVVDAKETSQMGVKFVEYTCVIVMTPKQSSGLDERSFVLSTRYKTMSKLHSALRKLHSQLYLKSSFPSFPESKWIGANDAGIIAERKAATETFLTFLLSQDVLRKARLFHQFIESAEEKVAEAEIVDVSSIITVGSGLLDSSNTIPASIVPVITPDNNSRPSSSLSTEFHFDDVSIEEVLSMANEGKGFIREYLSKFTKKNESEEYLVVAGRLISTAQLAETEGAYEAAFYSYKEAANVLIKGMESERSFSNRNAVRLKSAKFIEKAEQIYRNYLRYDNAPLFDTRNIPRDNEDEFAFRSSNSALKSFRFVGVLPDVEAIKRVFLVHETESDRYFVMKLIERRDDESGEGIFLPTNVPHMVPLVKFFTTTNYIILLLQYVKTGRLWSFLCRYLADSEKKYEDTERKCANEDFVETEIYNRENPYRGRHTRFSVTADCERLAVMENEGLQDSGEAAVICTVGEDVMEGEEDGDRAKYILVPSDTVTTNTMIVEEEAPAPLILSKNEKKEDKKKEKEKNEDGNESRSMTLADAMAECRECLKESKRCWLGTVPECLVIHWTAQCISMLYILHSHGVFIGDLHPDNLLIDEEGNLLFTYQAKWNNDGRDRCLLAGYSAPECCLLPSIISSPCDIWSLGSLLYELLIGRPLSSAAPHGIGNLCELSFIPDSPLISFSARDLLSRILQIDPLERMTIDQIRAHPFYSSIDWLLYDNPHGPVRIPMNREKNEEEKKKELAREKERLQNEATEIKKSEVANIEGDEEKIKKRNNERNEEENFTLSGDGKYSQRMEGETSSSTEDLPTFSGTRD